MNRLQRILSNIIGLKQYGGKPTWVTSRLGTSTVDDGTLLESNRDWVFIGIDKVAGAASSIRLKVMRYNKDQDTELFDHPLNEFLYSPHKQLTGRDFVYLTFAYKDLTGNAFWRIEKDGSRTVITPLLPTAISPVMENKDGSGDLLGYMYQTATKRITLLPTEVLHDRYPNPANPYWGKGALQRIASWIDTDSFATEFNKTFFENGASFGGMIESEAITQENIQLIKKGFIMNHTGSRNAHKIGVLPKGAKWVEGKANRNDMQFEQLSARLRDNILAGFGVPKAVAGIVDDVNRANAEASEYVFMKHTIKPKMDRFIDFLNMQIVPLFDKTGQIYIEAEEYIPENKDLELREIEVALGRQPFKTVNEVRSENGLPPITGGDIVYGNAMAAPIGSPQKDVNAVNPLSRGVKIEKANPIDKIALVAADFASKMTKSVETKAEDMDAIAHKSFVDRATDYQARLTDRVKDYNQRQRNEVIRSLGDILAKSTTGKTKLARADVLNAAREIGIMIDFVTPILGQLMRDQLIEEWNRNRYDGEPDVSDVRLQKVVTKAATRLAESYNDTTAKLIVDALSMGIGEGESIVELTDRINQIFDYNDVVRAKMVAHTETFYIANEGNREAYRQSGFVDEVRWYTSEAENVCEFCGPQNGRVIGIDDVFFGKDAEVTGRDGGKLTTSYRSIDNPPLHPNCNCFIRSVVKPIKSIENTQTVEKDIDGDAAVDKALAEIAGLFDIAI